MPSKIGRRDRRGKSCAQEEPVPIESTAATLLELCREPRSRKEIAKYLGLKTASYAVDRYTRPLLGGRKAGNNNPGQAEEYTPEILGSDQEWLTRKSVIPQQNKGRILAELCGVGLFSAR